MENWQKTGCVLCAQNCGLEVLIEDGRMKKVRPDRDNPRSRGYACRKGLNVAYHQYPADRITHPLKKVDGEFVPVSWEQAITEIAAKLKSTVAEHGPRSFAYMGASAQGGHLEAAFGLTLLRALGSQYFYSSAGQEFAGHWWVFGRMLGRQYNVTGPDEHHCDMLVAWGWNGMVSHQVPRAPIVLTEIARDPDRLLVSIDPRRSETARMANIHLPVRPGTDALLMKAMISIILTQGWEKTDYLSQRVVGWDTVRPWFESFDAKAAIAVCELDYGQVHDLCRLMAERQWGVHPDLGLFMGRHSTLNSYLLMILQLVCGRLLVPGGNIVPGMVMPMGFHTDERNDNIWRTIATKMPPAAAGAFPPAVLPEEILVDHPDRIRAVYVSACNPLRSYPDTTAYETAFEKLDLLVVNEIVMSETARLAHYVLPACSFYESHDVTFFPMSYPEVYLQLRRPIVQPPGECRELADIFTDIADKLGLIPAIPDDLHQAAAAVGDRLTFGAKLMEWASTEPGALAAMPFVLAKTLGRQWQSAHLASLWGLMMTAPKAFFKNAVRAGFAPGPDLGDRLFQAVLDNPQGLWVGKADRDNPMAVLKTDAGKIEAHIPELAEAAQSLDAAAEAEALQMPVDFPLVLNAGRHMKYNINTLMRNPEWNKGKRACTVAISPADAERLCLTDGQMVRVSTRAGSETGELAVSDQVRPGMVLIPHGFGLIYDGCVYGINVNRLTRNTHRDPFTGTPLHRFVPCRVEAA
ncbi:MAG: molybdopterin-dependent oxidoreductase [Thermodesulfobacteriota bacterium]|nr:molybdopterin-dependent oxidoreductase [Thermodesulfobacteriota bacterium]